MSSIKVRPLRDDLPFGARISGVTYAALEDEAVRTQVRGVFKDRSMIVFENVEPSDKMHVAISLVFGPLKDHPVKSVPRVDRNALPGVIKIGHTREKAGIVEIDGKQLSN
jgi:taurine dioxygenase